ncbi:ATP-binding protein [Asticcacaulis sp. 201]|uniref:ATP-binding protein n=1 Tax=Asticcacaulis sp. 201 TaxID=3028787 RepID=UPI0029168665|nr:ATP-binding protein [Asticcacaulis sp. 201]MDV6332173.1 ATP-binding protein [Asticcacaulis sp. 201]
MPRLRTPKNEVQRLDALAALDILDTPPEPAFDQLTGLAKLIFDVPIVLISLVDEERQWFKSHIGLDVDHTARDVSFCDHVIREDAVMIVTDALDDPRFSTNALVVGAPYIRFYAGAPVRYDKVLIGTLCVIDRIPRPDFGPAEARKLEQMAASVSSVLAMRKAALTSSAIIKAKEEGQKTLELVEDIAGIGQWSFNVKTGRVSWSDQVFRIHGLPIADEPPDYAQVLALYEPEDGAKLAMMVERALKTGQGYTLDARIRHTDGSLRNVVAKAVVLRSGDGEVETLNGVFQDVTDYRAAIEQSRQGEARHRLLAENMPGMLGYWDLDLKCRFANNAYFEWFNKQPDELMGVHLKTLLGPDIFALNQPYIRGALAGKKQIFERAMTKPTGAVGYMLAQYLPDFEEDGRVCGFYVMVTDITNMKLKELALADSNAQLIAARKQAEAALEIKAQFLATMSHEIRTPITTILGYANLLSDQAGLSQETQSFVKRIDRAGHTLLGIVNDILDVSRLEAGQMTLSPQVVNVRELARDTVDQFQRQAEAHNLNLTVAYDDALPEWQVIDDTRLGQILSNLVSNACKFTSDGNICVSMRAVSGQIGGRMRVEVSDPGPGLNTEQTRKLFQPFQQLDAGINRKHGGSGLGLAICAELLKLMQGEIGVASDVASGSTFWFEVPLKVATPASKNASLSGPMVALYASAAKK